MTIDSELIQKWARQSRKRQNWIIQHLKENEEPTPDPDPDPTPREMLIGVHSRRKEYTESVGREWDIIRVFNSGSFTSSIRGEALNYLNRGTVVHESFKTSGVPMQQAEQIRLAEFLGSVPDTAEYWLTLWHEPDQGGRVDAVQWGNLQRQLIDACATASNDRAHAIRPVAVLMGWGLGDPDTNERYLDAIEGLQAFLPVMVDCYNWPEEGGVRDLSQNYTASVFAELKMRGFKPGLAETATFTDDPKWYSRNAAWAEAEGAIAFEAFLEDKPQEDPRRTWDGTDAQIEDLANA